jgi:hypothetical protein
MKSRILKLTCLVAILCGEASMAEIPYRSTYSIEDMRAGLAPVVVDGDRLEHQQKVREQAEREAEMEKRKAWEERAHPERKMHVINLGGW